MTIKPPHNPQGTVKNGKKTGGQFSEGARSKADPVAVGARFDGMHDREDFISQDIAPALGDYSDDFDIDGIFADLCDRGLVVFTEHDGYRWADPHYADECPDWNDILAAHDQSAARGESEPVIC